MIGSVTQKLQRKYYSFAFEKQIKTSYINKIETKFQNQENPNQGLTTMLHCCINLYITYAIISEKLICFSSFSMQWYLLKIYCMQSKNLWKNSLALLSECCLSNVKKKWEKIIPVAFFQSRQYIFTITITDFLQIFLRHPAFLKLIDHYRVCFML